MTRQTPALRRKKILLAAAAALAAASGPTLAQTVGEITVVAPKVVREPAGHSARGVPLEMVSISHHVGYGDLDLTKAEDVATFKDRVRAAAKQGCSQLDNLYPPNVALPNPPDQNCEKAAAEDGLAQVDMVMAMAAGIKK